MTGTEVLDVARDAILTLVLVSAPLMLVGLVVGVVIATLTERVRKREPRDRARHAYCKCRIS